MMSQSVAALTFVLALAHAGRSSPDAKANPVGPEAPPSTAGTASPRPGANQPAPPVADGSQDASQGVDGYRQAPAGPTVPRRSDWWRAFGDARLDALIARGRDRSPDLAAAQSRIDEADAVVRQQLAPLLPQLTWDTSVTVAPLDSLGFQFGGAPSGGGGGGMPAPDLPTLYYTGSSVLNLGVDLDVAGRQRLQRRASRQDRRAGRADRDAAQWRMSASIVAAYYDVVTARAQLVISARQVEVSEELLAVTEARFELGQANAVDVLQQRQQVASAKTLVPQAQIQLRAFEQRLAVLIGEPPGPSFDTVATLPDLPPAPHTGRPSELVRARPDLRAQQLRLEAARQRERGAKRAFAPSLRLTGRTGVQFIDLGDFNSQWFWNAGAVISVPLYDGGTNLARLRQSQAQTKTAGHQLHAAVLTATREVEEALLREREQRRVVEALEAQWEAARVALDETRRRYRSGLGAYLPVLTALNTAQQAELGLVTARRDLLAARITLYQALGDTPAP
ncbi:MAG: efflux transporter outer membrane subunit [Myxococcales bacterium FL481]|nr:MAG: efflux transporter outer membrane subunit [Myxococcales bacterium FL481]